MAPCEERVCVLWVASLYHTGGYPVAESTLKYLLTTNNFVSAYRDCFAFCGRQTPRTATQSVRILLFRFRFHSSITILCMCSCISTILSAGDSMRLLWHACLFIVLVFFFFLLSVDSNIFFLLLPSHRDSCLLFSQIYWGYVFCFSSADAYSIAFSVHLRVLWSVGRKKTYRPFINHAHVWFQQLEWRFAGWLWERESAADHTLYKWCVCVLEMAMFVLFLLTVSWLCGHRSTSTHRVDQLAHRRVLWLQFLWHPK